MTTQDMGLCVNPAAETIRLGPLSVHFLVTVVIGVAAFFTGPMIWPMSHEVPMPPPNLLPAYIGIPAVEALAFGFAVAFAVFGWSAIRDLRFGAPWLNRLLFVTLILVYGELVDAR